MIYFSVDVKVIYLSFNNDHSVGYSDFRADASSGSFNACIYIEIFSISSERS